MLEAETCLAPMIFFLSLGRMVGMVEGWFLMACAPAVVSEGWEPVLGPTGMSLELGDLEELGAKERCLGVSLLRLILFFLGSCCGVGRMISVTPGTEKEGLERLGAWEGALAAAGIFLQLLLLLLLLFSCLRSLLGAMESGRSALAREEEDSLLGDGTGEFSNHSVMAIAFLLGVSILL